MQENIAKKATKKIVTWYALTIFLSSGILLVLEITAGRLIAPYVGATVYSWTAIIGVILTGISIGNYIGGSLADRGFDTVAVGVVLALSSLFALASLYVLSFIAPLIQESNLDLISSSFLYVLAMFFLPSVLLGIPTPMLTAMALTIDARLGHVVGKMHALAALGSIVGTFVTGFVLIQYMGSRNIIIFSAVLLFLLALPFLLKSLRIVVLFVISIIVIIFLTISRAGFANPCQYESSYFCMRVIDASAATPFGEARALILDKLMHGVNHKTDPRIIVSSYVELMNVMTVQHFGEDRALNYYFIGGGSYTYPRLVKNINPKNNITVAEIDPLVTHVAQKDMYVNTGGMNIVHSDARRVLHKLKDEVFDVIVADAFLDIAIPYHLVTKEFIELSKNRLSANGLFMINIVDIFPDPLMVKSLINTLKTQFSNVAIWVDEIPRRQKRLTFVVAASNTQTMVDDVFTSKDGYKSWYNISTPLEQTQTSLQNLPVLSDDYVPVERMIGNLLFTDKGL